MILHEPSAELVRMDGKPLDVGAPYSTVKSGSIVLKARIRPALCICNWSPDGVRCRLEHLPQDKPPGQWEDPALATFIMIPDAFEPEFSGHPPLSLKPIMVALIQMGRKRYNPLGPIGLVVRQVPRTSENQESTYTRLGLFYMDQRIPKRGPDDFYWDWITDRGALMGGAVIKQRLRESPKARAWLVRRQQEQNWFDQRKPMTLKIVSEMTRELEPGFGIH